MFIPFLQGAQASTNPIADSAAAFCALPPNGSDNSAGNSECSEYEPVRHMIFGTPSAVRSTVHLLYKLHYAEPNDWSQPTSTGRPNEVMAILTKRVRIS
ncbi:MAG: hypothetical protein WBD47_10365 [Phormidesmis sp.]